MASDYPAPLVISPRQLPHKQTFIILHGRGSSAEKFGPTLADSQFQLNSTTPSGESEETTTTTTLAATFPHARFVFPTAARRRATVYGRAYTHQWFDNWKLDPPVTAREELQAPGLRETVAYLHGLLRAETAQVPGGSRSVVLGGLSQGCAAALVTLLLWESEPPLAAAFGMCGWLPYAARLSEQVSQGVAAANDDKRDDDGDAFDPFERSDGEDEGECDPPTRAVSWLREEIQLERSSSTRSEEEQNDPKLVFQRVPVFLGHGVEDDRVGVVLGRTASQCLRDLGCAEVELKEYSGLGHWYSAEMLRDLVSWMKAKTGW
ncbi:Alpha/Beta hydrolase protein [Apodospora peruviana]|uniref:Alpha/Beta hydrolase protein n=1 Tax=Apodospora peruviana TaxID=516989 RepID=A0AAE0M8S8_9PEZI|nr:Alpha/Beta hydrolase protein [Apodospora peruviana]